MKANDLEFLLQSPYFDGCSTEQIQDFASKLSIYFFEEGEELFAEGDMGDGWYLLREGDVEIIRSSIGGPPHTLAEISEGEAFGEIALLEKSTRMASVVAINDVRVFKLEAETFDGLLQSHDPIAMKILRQMAIAQSRRLREITTILQDITDPSAFNAISTTSGGALDVDSFIRSNLLLNMSSETDVD